MSRTKFVKVRIPNSGRIEIVSRELYEAKKKNSGWELVEEVAKKPSKSSKKSSK